jgi:hypothetical protein
MRAKADLDLSARGPSGGLIPPPASPHGLDDTMAKIVHAGTPEEQG